MWSRTFTIKSNRILYGTLCRMIHYCMKHGHSVKKDLRLKEHTYLTQNGHESFCQKENMSFPLSFHSVSFSTFGPLSLLPFLPYFFSSVSSPPTHLLCLTPLSLFCLSLSLSPSVFPLYFSPLPVPFYHLKPWLSVSPLYFFPSVTFTLFLLLCLSFASIPPCPPLVLPSIFLPLYPTLSPHSVFGLFSLLTINLH